MNANEHGLPAADQYISSYIICSMFRKINLLCTFFANQIACN